MEYINDTSNGKLFLYITVVLLILAISSIVIYFGMKQFRKLKENNEYRTGTDYVEFTFYYVDWCPYSTQAEPIWNEVTKSFAEKTTASGKNIKFIKKDCTEESEDDQSKVNGEIVDSFPSIFFNNLDGKDQLEFKAKCTQTSLSKFINYCINEN